MKPWQIVDKLVVFCLFSIVAVLVFNFLLVI